MQFITEWPVIAASMSAKMWLQLMDVLVSSLPPCVPCFLPGIRACVCKLLTLEWSTEVQILRLVVC